MGIDRRTGLKWFTQAGGMPPVELAEPSGRYLSFSEREEIALHRAAGLGVRASWSGSPSLRERGAGAGRAGWSPPRGRAHAAGWSSSA